MEEYVAGRRCQLSGIDAYCVCSIPDIRHDGNGLLDGWMVICEFVICGGTDDVCFAVFQSILF